ncbi:unnamed protein product [Somion occarium]|uniref:RING-type domain-containing protein n=1 Tax=Somion occarium TaxID=3059160 RepID=A0ABP1DS92_9APHY
MPASQDFGVGSSRKRRLSASSDTSVDGEENEIIVSRNHTLSPVRRALPSSAIVATKPEEETPKSGRDKKKRRKKRRKVSVVQDTVAADKPLPQSSNGMLGRHPSSAAIMDAAEHTSVINPPVAGPSNARIPSPSLAPTSVTQTFPIVDLAEEMSYPRPECLVGPARENDTNGSLPKSPTTSVDKGKGKAVDEDVTHTTTLSEQATANGLGAHQAMLGAVLPSLTCRVCLFLMHRPFALAPCGHVVCHGCLVNWFSQPAPSAAPNLPALPTTRRKKTCPHCRAVVSERPVEVWALKETVTSLVKSGLVDADLISAEHEKDEAETNVDAWKDIFPPLRPIGRRHGLPDLQARELLGVQDAEDGGIYRCVDCMHEIWDGICSGCHREYPVHRDLHIHDDDDSDLDSIYADDFMEPPRGDGNLLAMLLSGAFANAAHIPDSELHSDDDDFGDDVLSDLSEGLDVDEDEEYEGSFIDDGDDVEVLDAPPRRHPNPGRRRGRVSANPIVLSSDDEEEDNAEQISVPGGGSSSRVAGSRSRVIHSDDEDEVTHHSEEDHHDEDIVEHVAHRDETTT